METQLIAQVGVAKQYLHLRSGCRLIQMVRALPTQNMFCTLTQDGLVAQLVQVVCRLVCVQQFRVPNGLCLHTEDALEQLALFLELLFHLALVVLRSQRVTVRRGEELYAFRSGQILQDINHLGVELLEHLNHRTAYAQRAVELTLTQINHVADGLTQRHVRSLYQPVYMFLRGHVIIVVMVMADIKETITLQTIRCMHLKAKTYIFHNAINFL